ncbi:biotin/lipoyl-containing protein, partial [Frankia sp. EI5c]|uniref:biotin/lipoyl-containing protein n=1 Tax=Frankia sp. EI5c TaxID=683316 RepID=UPI001F5B282B
MSHRQFRLPDLGEGLTEAEIVRWLVDAGETVTVNQPLVEVETAKAVVEIPSPFAGVLVERHCEAGTELAVGAPLLTIDTADGEAAAEPPGGVEPRNGAAALPTSRPGESLEAAGGPGPSGPERPSMAAGRTPMLVGYGPRGSEPGRRRRRRPGADATTDTTRDTTRDTAAAGATAGPAAGTPAGPARVAAKPPVRKLARDLGVDLSELLGTGPAGSISRADVEAAARRVSTTAAGVGTIGLLEPNKLPEPNGHAEANGHVETTRPLPGAVPAGTRFDPDVNAWRIPVTGVRRSMARAMVASVSTAPHVTEFLSVDVTEAMAARERISALPEFAGIRVTPLLLTAKALLTAVRRHPLINASW